MSNPFGPFTPDQFKALTEAPAGKALAEIRKHDPLWGKPVPEGKERRKYKVRLERTITYSADVTVDAFSEDEAEELAEDFPRNRIQWDGETDQGIYVLWAEQID